MKFTIVTPTFNRLTYLDETIKSVVTQKGDFEIEYVIRDGGSGEELIAVLEKWKSLIEKGDFDLQCNRVSFRYVVEPDDGMYDAINKGFAGSDGEVMAWINSDDMYHPGAFQTVSQVLSKYNNVRWVTGIPNSYNHMSSRTGFDSEPASYSREYLRCGYYDVNYSRYGFNWIQQESTFWRRSLWDGSGKLDINYRYAADYYLWRSFAEKTDLVRIQSFLGGYRVHTDQITASPELYRRELPDLSSPSFSLKLLKITFKLFPMARRLCFNARKGWPILPLLSLKFGNLVGRVVEWSYPENDWVIRAKSIL